jgi:hypothetical protein
LRVYPRPTLAPARASVLAVPSPTPGVLLVETEPNDSVATANPLSMGDTVSGVIDPVGDVDYYAVALTAGEWVEFDIDAQSLTGGSDLDSYITLYDATGDSILAMNDDWAGLDSYLMFAAANDGTYFLQVTTCCGPGPGGGGVNHVYQLRVASVTLDTDEVEPNDVPGEATAIALGDSSLRAVILPAADVDFFAIDIAEAGVLRVTWFPWDWWFPATLRLWDADGTTALDSARADWGEWMVEAFVSGAGRYYISVEDAYQDQSFPYPRLYGLSSSLIVPGPGDPTTLFASGLGRPRQVVPDWTGNLVVLNIDENRIIQVGGDGSVAVLASFPSVGVNGMTVDGFGSVLIAGYEYSTGRSGIWRVGSGGTRTLFTTDTVGVHDITVLGTAPTGDVWAASCTSRNCPALLRFDPLGNLQGEIAIPDWIADMAFSPSGVLHFTNGWDRVFRLSGTTVQTVIEAPVSVEGLAFDEDGYLYVANGDLGHIDRYSPSYVRDDEPFAITNLAGPILLSFYRHASGEMSSRLFAANWGYYDTSLMGTMVEMNPAGMRAPGALVGAQLLGVSTALLRGGTIGAEYADTLELDNPPGGVPAWSVIEGALPPGLALAPTSGVISGTPTAEGTSAFTVHVALGDRIGFGRFTITVGEPTVAVTQAVDAALGVEGLLTPELERFLDIRGNNNGRFDIGDLRAYLRAEGVLASKGASGLSAEREE